MRAVWEGPGRVSVPVVSPCLAKVPAGGPERGWAGVRGTGH